MYCFIVPYVVDKSSLTQTLSTGSVAHFVCIVNGYPLPTVSWTHNNVTLTYTGSILTVNDITLSDAGIYQCIASNIVGEVAVDFELNIFRDLTFLSLPNTVNIQEGQELQLQCIVIGLPTPYINWLYNGIIITDTRVNITRFTDGSSLLVILNSLTNDTGNYTCITNGSTISYTHIVTINPLTSKY